MTNKIVICDLDGTLIPYDSSRILIKNNKKKIEHNKKYYNPLNYIKAGINLIRSIFGITLNNGLFYENENVELIEKLVKEEFAQREQFNENIVEIIDSYERIIVLTGTSEIIAKTILSKLPDNILMKIEIIGSILENKDGVFTGRILNHPFGFNKRKILKKKFNKQIDGIGNSIYDLPFLDYCKTGFFFTKNNFLITLISLLWKNRIKCICL